MVNTELFNNMSNDEMNQTDGGMILPLPILSIGFPSGIFGTIAKIITIIL